MTPYNKANTLVADTIGRMAALTFPPPSEYSVILFEISSNNASVFSVRNASIKRLTIDLFFS